MACPNVLLIMSDQLKATASHLYGNTFYQTPNMERLAKTTQQWKYVHDPMGDRDELYDLINDPWELTNVVDKPEHQEIVSELQFKLLQWGILTEDSLPVSLP